MYSHIDRIIELIKIDPIFRLVWICFKKINDLHCFGHFGRGRLKLDADILWAIKPIILKIPYLQLRFCTVLTYEYVYSYS